MRIVQRLFLLLAGVWVVGLSASQAVGDVVQIQGIWLADKSSKPLVAGDGVAAGALIRADLANGQGIIVVALLNRTELSANCSAPPCTATLQIPSDPASPDISFANILAAVQFVLLNREAKVTAAYASTSSRGIGPARSEVVLPFENSKPLALTPDLPGLPGGKYDLELLRIEDNKIVYSGKIQWSGSDLKLAFSPLNPGLYVLSLTNRFGRTKADILLALVPTGSLDSVRSKYEEARRDCGQWADPMAADASHLLLRAYLIALEEHR